MLILDLLLYTKKRAEGTSHPRNARLDESSFVTCVMCLLSYPQRNICISNLALVTAGANDCASRRCSIIYLGTKLQRAPPSRFCTQKASANGASASSKTDGTDKHWDVNIMDGSHRQPRLLTCGRPDCVCWPRPLLSSTTILPSQRNKPRAQRHHRSLSSHTLLKCSYPPHNYYIHATPHPRCTTMLDSLTPHPLWAHPSSRRRRRPRGQSVFFGASESAPPPSTCTLP